jgi:hypothetical protein
MRNSSQRLAIGMVVVTLLACGGALLYRDALYARYWAYRIQTSPDHLLRLQLAARLGRFGSDAHWGIHTLLTSENPEDVQLGLLAAQTLRDEWSVDQMKRFAQDPDPLVQRAAVLGLAACNTPEAVTALTKLFEHGDPETRVAAIIGLADLARTRPAAAELLAEFVQVPAAPAVRGALVHALRDVPAALSLPALVVLTHDDRVVPAGSVALRLMSPASAGATDSEDGVGGERVAMIAARQLDAITGMEVAPQETASAAEWQAARRAWLTFEAGAPGVAGDAGTQPERGRSADR